MNDILSILTVLAVCVPFLLLVWLNSKNNLKKPYRSRQGFMIPVAIVFCIVAGLMLGQITEWVIYIFKNLDDWLEMLAGWVGGLFNGSLGFLASALVALANWVESLFRNADLYFWAAVVSNVMIILAYIPVKRVMLTVFRFACHEDSALYGWCANLVYAKRQNDGAWCVKPHMEQGITLTKALYYTTVIFGMLGISVSAYLFTYGLIASLYYPVFSVIMVGELYFFLDGQHACEDEGSVTGEDDRSTKICDYTFLRDVLRRTFGDKLLSDNTTVNSSLTSFRTNDEMINALEEDNEVAVEAYGLFMRKKAKEGLEIDQNYMQSGLQLLNRKSVLFNNPFYYDLIPYIFYPMNRAILRRKKVLIVLGRHAIEEDVETWCREGLTAVNYMPYLWNIGVLGAEQQNPDVGIITRSSVHDLKMHENNADFLAEVDFVVLIEPSRLIATAQIGLNSLVRHCHRGGNRPVFCSTDKNCDGIVDALSHILMTSLEEVSATNKHEGTSSYMCWEADEEHLQHRLLPNISRYLGGGTELSFAALQKQVSKTSWYGGDAFPVRDVHWIAKQYYYDLMKYAALPTKQAEFDEVFTSSPNMWDAKMQENNYLTVEDESFNMYEIKRAFSTRATNQGFINVISTDYLLKDYMADNDGIFDADSKAIPYIVADYAHTERNVVYRLFLRLSALTQTAEDIERELALINVDPGEDIIETLWSLACRISQGVGVRHFDSVTDQEQLHITKNGKAYVFDRSVIRAERKYLFTTGEMATVYSIRDAEFTEVFLGDLCSAQYVAEDEGGDQRFLGTELWGHIFQKYLPGQFFTFGGKYYEMLGLASDGRVMVRRAADHITGRPQYRQVRNYTLKNVSDSTQMGSKRDFSSFCITRQVADIAVETPAYWQMARYNDFAHAKKISINGVPTREYYNKQFLKIDFSKELVADKVVLDTVAMLMNEVFRTLYAENQGMIVAVTAGDAQAPLTYSLNGDACEDNSIYVIEDSQLDIGFLVSVERNLPRIFSIICDYLEWHTATLEKSLHPPVEKPKTDYTVADGQAEEETMDKGIKGFFRKIGRAIKSFWEKIKNFFRKLFGRKPKNEQTPPETSPAAGEQEAVATSEEGVGEETLTPVEEEVAEQPTEVIDVTQEASKSETQAETVEQEPTETPDEEMALMNVAPPKRLYSVYAEQTSEGALPSQEPVSDQPEESQKPAYPERRPYHERYYLLFGGESEPENICVSGALEAMRQLGFGKGFLEQARNGKSEFENLENQFDPNRAGSRYCDFCGAELFGTEYEEQVDGRERCTQCSRSAVKTEAEFKKLYETALRNLKTFFGISLNVPIKVQMVNAKTLHARLNQRFTPTSQADARILGVAIRDKKKGYTILLENGSPRLSATMTIVHELTHIWQYLNWDDANICKLYGKQQHLQIYEGMAKWVEIQYAYLINERATAKREEIITRLRQDEYGIGFLKYDDVYPLSYGTRLLGETPFANPQKPL